VDAHLLTLLNHRAALGLRVGRLKKRHGLRLFDPTREHAILQRMTRANGGPLSAQAVRAIYRAILVQIRRLERGTHP
jgi:chorismate mutase/prephenate dehydratase